jgi:NADPH:quinone reductase
VIPEQLSFDDAASLPIGSAAAREAIFRDQDRLPAGVDRVLILGGAGGISDSVQIAVVKNQYLYQLLTRPRDNGVGVT